MDDVSYSDGDECDGEDQDLWWQIPEEVLLKILLYLTPDDAVNVGYCCKRWNKITRDDYLWKRYFQKDFSIDKNIGIKPGRKRKYFYAICLLSFHRARNRTESGLK
jgi:hypothetical protein